MLPVLIETNSKLKTSIMLKKVVQPCLDAPLHFHHGYEMVYVQKSHGKRIVGDSVENFSEGDLVLMGPDLPHVWYNHKEYYDPANFIADAVEATVLYFQPTWWSPEFLKSKEFMAIGEVLSDSKRGLKIMGRTKKRILKRIRKFNQVSEFKKVVLLMDILEILSGTKEYEVLATSGYVNSYRDKDISRINKVYEYVMSNFTTKLKLDDVAEIANMTPTAFCKYFKNRTQKTFSRFVNEIRISYACKLLYNDDLSISQICYESGFGNITNFNKYFKMFTEKSPSEFRNSIRRTPIDLDG